MCSSDLVRLVKKEVLSLQREKAKLERSLGGIQDMNGLPDALFLIDVRHEYIAVAEANKLDVPVVAVTDTNSTPDGIECVIPANDDAIRAIRLYVRHAADAVLRGREAAAVVPGDAEDEFVEIGDEGLAKPVRPVRRKIIVKKKSLAGDQTKPALEAQDRKSVV